MLPAKRVTVGELWHMLVDDGSRVKIAANGHGGAVGNGATHHPLSGRRVASGHRKSEKGGMWWST